MAANAHHLYSSAASWIFAPVPGGALPIGNDFTDECRPARDIAPEIDKCTAEAENGAIAAEWTA